MIVAPSTAVRPATASTDRPSASSQSRFRVAVLLEQVGQPRERRIERVGNRRHDRLAPPIGPRGDDEQRAAALVRAHRHRQLHQDVHRIAPRPRRVEPEERGQQRRAVRKARRVLVHDLHLVRLEHGDVGELQVLAAAVLLDHDQSRRGHFEHHAVRRERADAAPHRQHAVLRRDAEMDAGALDRGRDLGQRRGESGSRRAKSIGCGVASGETSASEIVGT